MSVYHICEVSNISDSVRIGAVLICIRDRCTSLLNNFPNCRSIWNTSCLQYIEFPAEFGSLCCDSQKSCRVIFARNCMLYNWSVSYVGHCFSTIVGVLGTTQIRPRDLPVLCRGWMFQGAISNPKERRRIVGILYFPIWPRSPVFHDIWLFIFHTISRLLFWVGDRD